MTLSLYLRRAELAIHQSYRHRNMEAVKPTSRMAARLADLPRSQLLEIAAAGCEASIEVKNRADAILAAHKPLAQRAVEGVLLSSDLLPPHLLAPLQLEDCAAAAVCSRWAEDWKATGEGWRRLRKVDFPQDLLPHWPYSMAVIPGDDEYIDELVVQSGSMPHILGRGMRKITSFKLPTSSGTIAASEEFLYVTGRGRIIPGRITSLTHDGIEVATWEDQKCIGRPVLGPDGLLFCMICNSADYGYDEIVALDAETLSSLATGLGIRRSTKRVAWWWLARSFSSPTTTTTGCKSSHSRASTAARSRASGSGP